MKKYLVFAAAAAMFAACSENDLSENQKVEGTTAAEIPLSFEAYTQRGLTRSGYVGDLTQGQLQKTEANGGGFGVFGYYTDNNDYDQQSMPNFMYNQLVTYGSSKWEYSPIKYWPNEYGNAAISDDYDKVSFFAYAPFVRATAATGKVDDATWGIAGFIRNTAAGDPIVKYIGSFDTDKCVDLCWGVVGKDATAWPTVQPAQGTTQPYTQMMSEGMPWKDVRRPGLSKVTDPDQKMKFTFMHALAKLNVTIDTYADKIEPNAPATDSKVYVRSITFSGFAQKGALNLNNDIAFKPKWVDFSGTDDLTADDEIIIYDGRKDGKEGVASAVATNEKTLGLNPAIISNDGNTTAGVTNATVNLFRKWNKDSKEYEGAGSDPIYIIPTGEEITVTIVYDIETEDDKLPTLLSDGKKYGSSIENRIEQKISFGTSSDDPTDKKNKFEAGKAYTIRLHLGMNSVKFDADIRDWEDATDIDVDLPSNLPVYAAESDFSAATHTLTLPAETTTYTFAVSGLNAGESTGSEGDASATDAGVEGKVYAVTKTTDAAGGDQYDAKSNGIAVETASIQKNMYTSDKPAIIKVWGLASSKGVYIDVTKQAHALGLKFTVTNAATSFTLNSNNGANDVIWAEDVTPANQTKFLVKKNGTKLTNTTETTVNPNEFKYTKVDGNKTATITLGEPASKGDVFTVTIQAGDAKEETYSYTVQ